MTGWGAEWPAARELWGLEDGILHLNHGSFGAVPRPVLAAQRALQELIERNPVRFFAREIGARIDAARERAAAFLNADPGGLAFLENATQAVATVLAAVGLEPGDELLLTDHAYNAVLVAARRTSARIVVAHVPLAGPDEIVAAILDAVTERTRLAIVDHITSPTAVRFPVERVVPALRERGVPCMVDAAHAPGMVDVNLTALDPDFWTGNFHKWAGAPRGAGALYVRAERRASVRPLAASHLDDEPYPVPFGWVGTRDPTAHLCVPLALDVLGGLGWERLRAHNASLARSGSDVVAAALGTASHVADGLSMALVELPPCGVATAGDARVIADRIACELGAEVVVSAWNGAAYLRLSAQAYNSTSDYERLAALLPPLLAR